jgi:hypothetical protein
VPEVTTHSFRKTVATLIDDEGLSARIGADHLGHSKVSMTQDRYRHAALRTAESPPEQQTPLWRRFGGGLGALRCSAAVAGLRVWSQTGPTGPGICGR